MFYGYGCSSPLLLILLFIGVVGCGRYGYGGGYNRTGNCVSSCNRGYRKYSGVSKRSCYSQSSCGSYGNNRSNRLILYIILLFLYGGCFGGYGLF
ncbi:hypothetical protein IMX26_01545 [Clostridium sp. 'deep sea']|uniref:hypothetical protein n=1 Tax=Clostridium sp. 'deep sea' TaxID=2779445 RepID=UPI0018965C21|nr:hypothetical protein [Clostridium sp. 'deep sea']QOR35554.1 hypothetical protein IMX26_01545 [Clostridium sp. 'deep sea']